MTSSEQKSIDRFLTAVNGLMESNRQFQESVNLQIKAMDSKIESKHLPYSLEAEIVTSAQTAIGKSISEALGGYNSPLQKYASNVVSRYQGSIENIFDEIVKEGIQSPEFKIRVREVLLNKIAKTVVSGIDGSIDKTVNLMKQDAIFRSRLTLAVNTLVEEFLTQKDKH